MNRNLTAFIMIVIAVGIYLTATQSVLNDANQVKSVNDQYSLAISNANRLAAVREQVLDDYGKISDNDKARLDKMIPSTADNIRLRIDLLGVANSHQLALQGLTISVSPSGSGQAGPPAAAGSAASAGNGMASVATTPSLSAPVLDTGTVSFSVTGSYDQLMSLLQALEADLRIMDLTHLTVTASDKGAYDFSLQFKTYWLRQTS